MAFQNFSTWSILKLKRNRKWNSSIFGHFKILSKCYHMTKSSFTCFLGHFILPPVECLSLIDPDLCIVQHQEYLYELDNFWGIHRHEREQCCRKLIRLNNRLSIRLKIVQLILIWTDNFTIFYYRKIFTWISSNRLGQNLSR